MGNRQSNKVADAENTVDFRSEIDEYSKDLYREKLAKDSSESVDKSAGPARKVIITSVSSTHSQKSGPMTQSCVDLSSGSSGEDKKVGGFRAFKQNISNRFVPGGRKLPDIQDLDEDGDSGAVATGATTPDADYLSVSGRSERTEKSAYYSALSDQTDNMTYQSALSETDDEGSERLGGLSPRISTPPLVPPKPMSSTINSEVKTSKMFLKRKTAASTGSEDQQTTLTGKDASPQADEGYTSQESVLITSSSTGGGGKFVGKTPEIPTALSGGSGMSHSSKHQMSFPSYDADPRDTLVLKDRKGGAVDDSVSIHDFRLSRTDDGKKMFITETSDGGRVLSMMRFLPTAFRSDSTEKKMYRELELKQERSFADIEKMLNRSSKELTEKQTGFAKCEQKRTLTEVERVQATPMMENKREIVGPKIEAVLDGVETIGETTNKHTGSTQLTSLSKDTESSGKDVRSTTSTYHSKSTVRQPAVVRAPSADSFKRTEKSSSSRSYQMDNKSRDDSGFLLTQRKTTEIVRPEPVKSSVSLVYVPPTQKFMEQDKSDFYREMHLKQERSFADLQKETTASSVNVSGERTGFTALRKEKTMAAATLSPEKILAFDSDNLVKKLEAVKDNREDQEDKSFTVTKRSSSTVTDNRRGTSVTPFHPLSTVSEAERRDFYREMHLKQDRNFADIERASKTTDDLRDERSGYTKFQKQKVWTSVAKTDDSLVDHRPWRVQPHRDTKVTKTISLVNFHPDKTTIESDRRDFYREMHLKQEKSFADIEKTTPRDVVRDQPTGFQKFRQQKTTATITKDDSSIRSTTANIAPRTTNYSLRSKDDLDMNRSMTKTTVQLYRAPQTDVESSKSHFYREIHLQQDKSFKDIEKETRGSDAITDYRSRSGKLVEQTSYTKPREPDSVTFTKTKVSREYNSIIEPSGKLSETVQIKKVQQPVALGQVTDRSQNQFYREIHQKEDKSFRETQQNRQVQVVPRKPEEPEVWGYVDHSTERYKEDTIVYPPEQTTDIESEVKEFYRETDQRAERDLKDYGSRVDIGSKLARPAQPDFVEGGVQRHLYRQTNFEAKSDSADLKMVKRSASNSGFHDFKQRFTNFFTGGPSGRKSIEDRGRTETRTTRLHRTESMPAVNKTQYPLRIATNSFTKKGDSIVTSKILVNSGAPLPTRKPMASIPSEPPLFLTPLANVDTFAGERVVLEARVKGDPEPDIQWRHNNRPIRDSRDYKLFYDGYVATLTIPEAYPNHAGGYSIHAKNRAGEASSTSSVIVRAKVPESDSEVETGKPRFIQELRNVVVTEGDPARLDCIIIGNPEPEVIWFKEEFAFKESANRQLTFEGDRCSMKIPRSQLSDGGLYKCVARNKHGESTSFCKLTVLPKPPPPKPAGKPPKFIENLESQVVEEGTKIVFEARVTGDPPPTIRWFYNEREIRPGPDVQIQSDPSGWLRLTKQKASTSDEGTFMVMASNTHGEAKSICKLKICKPKVEKYEQSKYQHEHQYYQVTPSATPPEIVKHLPDISLPRGENVVMECIVIGNPKPKITWYFRGKQVSSSHLNFTSSGDTHIVSVPNVSPETCGDYRLVAENIAGKAETFGNLSIAEDRKMEEQIVVRTERLVAEPPKEHIVPPKFTRTLVSVVVVEGQPATLDGLITGIPSPEVTWQKDGVDFQDNRAQIVYNNNKVSLHIDKCKLSDSGKFVCAARNKGGLATSSAQLVVRPLVAAPDFKKRLISKEIEDGTTLRWEVQVVGDPEPKVTWYRNDQPIRSGPGIQILDEGHGVHVLVLNKASLADGGQFTVKAENVGGEARSTADLVVRPLGQDPSELETVTKVFQEKQEAGIEISSHQTGWYQSVSGKQIAGDFNTSSSSNMIGSSAANTSSSPYPKAFAPSPQPQLTPVIPNVSSSSQRSNKSSQENRMTVLQEMGTRGYQPQNPQGGRFVQPVSQKRLEQQINTQQKYDTYMSGRAEDSDAWLMSESESDFESTGPAPPTFRQKLKPLHLSEGQDAVFRCSITGNPTPKIQWTKDGKVLAQSQRYSMSYRGTTAELRIKMVFPEDAGTYAVICQNEYGQGQSSVNLEIVPFGQQTSGGQWGSKFMTQSEKFAAVSGVAEQESASQPPQVLRAPEVVTVREHQVARIDVKLAGQPYPTVEWFKDNTPLADSPKYKILVNQEGVHSLLINHVEASDQGTFVCLARNSGGEARIIVTLSVQASTQSTAPQFTEKFQSLTIFPGDSITLRCKTTGNPPPKLQWMKDQTQLTNGSPYTIEERDYESTLYIHNATLADSGWFLCTAVNSGGSNTIRGRITVQEKKVHSGGIPMGVGELPPDHAQGEIVNLRHVERAHHGARKEEEDIRIVAPKFESQPHDLGTLREGASAHFECRLVPTNDPDLKVVWLHDGKPILASSRVHTMFDFGYATLDINPIGPEDSGTYTIQASNALGQASASASMSIMEDARIITSSLLSPEASNSFIALEMRRANAATRHGPRPAPYQVGSSNMSSSISHHQTATPAYLAATAGFAVSAPANSKDAGGPQSGGSVMQSHSASSTTTTSFSTTAAATGGASDVAMDQQ